MRLRKLRRFPYFAQLGDEVVYFFQGHDTYINAVMDKQLYHPSSKMLVRRDLDPTEVCIVDGVRYTANPYRLCCVRLHQYRNGSRVGGTSFEIYFHDIENVADFIVLKQHFDEAMRHRFEPGASVEAIVDEKFFTGVVQARTLHQVGKFCKNSGFQILTHFNLIT